MADVTLAVLSYASAPTGRARWGPVWFWPSRRSLILALLAVGAFAWLALRHEPWTHVRSFDADEANRPGFTADGLFLTFEGARGANLWEPATGRHVRTVVPRLAAGRETPYATESGRGVLVIPQNGMPAAYYDARPGASASQPTILPNPIGWGATIERVSPGTPYVITQTYQFPGPKFEPYGGETLYLWELSAGSPPKVRSLPYPLRVKLSADGSRLIQWRDRPKCSVVLVEAPSLRVVWEKQFPGMRIRDAGFAVEGGEDVFAVIVQPLEAPAAGAVRKDIIEVRSSKTGELRHRIDVPAAPAYAVGEPTWYTLSGGGRTLALVGSPRPGAGGLPLSTSVEFWDVASGRKIGVRYVWREGAFGFRGPDDRYFSYEPASGSVAQYDPRYASPVARLRWPGRAPAWGYGTRSADGRAVFCMAMVRSGSGVRFVVELYRKTGWDCAESPLGVIAMPPAWGSTLAFVALCVSLHGDARRRAVGVAPRLFAPISLIVLLAALPRALHLLLVAATQNRLLLTPALLLVGCAIGLGTGGRFWRVVMMAMLAGQLSLSVYCLYRVKVLGVRGSSPIEILDRNWVLPHLPVAVVLGLATLLIPFLIYALARKRSHLLG
jgi:hypothetical protein